MKVIEIFKSIEGEGIRAGLPVTFIRLAGCNLRCTYCDTQYSYNEESKGCKVLTVEEIVAQVELFEIPFVTITGGEPLAHDGICNLITALRGIGCHINVETNGTFPVPKQFEYCDDVIFTMDWKCPSSGMNGKMDIATIGTLRSIDVLKFVVGSEEDLNEVVRVRDMWPIECTRPSIFISPVFGQIEPAQIVSFMLAHKMYDCRVQLQMHKFIWAPEMRGV